MIKRTKMPSLAVKNLLAEKTRLLISVGGVALSVLIILVIISLYSGWKDLIANYIRSIPVDFWVTQEGAADMSHSVSILPSSLKGTLEQIAGVGEVHRLVGRQISLDVKGEEVHLRVFGYDTQTGIGGPPRMLRGKNTPSRGEIVIDRVFAQENKLNVDDELTIADRTFKVVGISDDGNYIFAQLAFIPIEDAEDLFEMQVFTNWFLVKAKAGEDLASLKVRLEDLTSGLTVSPKQEFLEENQKLVTETFLPIIGVLVFISFLVGVAVVGLTVYTATIEKSREYGVLKALGASNSYLYRTIIIQSLISGVLGFILGTALSYGVNYVAIYFVPEFVTKVRIPDVIGVLGAVVVMSIIASNIPIRRIAQIDPMKVFKS